MYFVIINFFYSCFRLEFTNIPKPTRANQNIVPFSPFINRFDIWQRYHSLFIKVKFLVWFKSIISNTPRQWSSLNDLYRSFHFMLYIMKNLIIFDLKTSFNNSNFFILKQSFSTLMISGQIEMRSLEFSSTSDCRHDSSRISNICTPNFTRVYYHNCESCTALPNWVCFLSCYCWVWMGFAKLVFKYFWFSKIVSYFFNSRFWLN